MFTPQQKTVAIAGVGHNHEGYCPKAQPETPAARSHKMRLRIAGPLVYTWLLRCETAHGYGSGEMSELAEGARLEIVYTSKGYPGFKSPSLRHF